MPHSSWILAALMQVASVLFVVLALITLLHTVRARRAALERQRKLGWIRAEAARARTLCARRGG